MSADRDLAEAIHHEIISPASVETALRVWDDLAVCIKTWPRDQRMRFLLERVTASAIDRVLARRVREAARTGPWEGGHHFQEEDGYPGSLVPPKRDET